ncbi:Lysine methyltransferase [Dillenia turbinata]|uniref:Lysine methyltransferase n=1 Tax=Dillenia turbinata TaxID=194707 RepID=A0AAN8UJ52_9MAGN
MEDQVMSEVHIGCPPGVSGPHLSHFFFSIPSGVEQSESSIENDGAISGHQGLDWDDDGDLVLTRRNKLSNKKCGLTIQHMITSSIPSVGLQVWRAELILADFVLHRMFTSSDFEGITTIELGAGTGLVGILLARVAKSVFLTDHGEQILENCAANVCLNSAIFNSQAAVHVRELDWKNSWPPKTDFDYNSQKRFSWTISEFEEAQRASLLVAADVIYSDDLTDALFSMLEAIMSHGPDKVLYMALEKRYNFSLDDLDVVANGYSHFRSYLRDGGDNAELGSLGDWHFPPFFGKCVDLSEIPQYIRQYDRGNDVELWQIKYEKRKP